MQSFGIRTSLLDKKGFLLMMTLLVVGFLSGLWGCHVFGKENEKCNTFKNWGTWVTFILGVFLLGLMGRYTFAGTSSLGF